MRSVTDKRVKVSHELRINLFQLSSKPAPLVMAYKSFSRSTCWKALILVDKWMEKWGEMQLMSEAKKMSTFELL
jgi:hypothetical protein